MMVRPLGLRELSFSKSRFDATIDDGWRQAPVRLAPLFTESMTPINPAPTIVASAGMVPNPGQRLVRPDYRAALVQRSI